jgi:hypothetical protein
MAYSRLSMRNIFEVLRLSVSDGRSHREIARAIIASPTTVGEILRRAKLAGLSYPLPTGLSEAEVEMLLYPSSAPSKTLRPEPDWAGVHRELRRKGVTLDLLWQEYKGEHPTGFQCSILRPLPGLGWPLVGQPAPDACAWRETVCRLVSAQ